MVSQVSVALEHPSIHPPSYGISPEVDRIEDYRVGAYRLVASLLRSSPDQAMLEHVYALSKVEDKNDELSVALRMLGLAARRCEVASIDDEYHALFIGLGRGELVPYGSWYMTGFLMEKPLATLRDDLLQLGYERGEGTHEPEDHIAALAEVMSMMIEEGLHEAIEGNALALQKRFFDAHIDSWAERFFSDMTQSSSAVFYRSVGRFGAAFMKFERQYLSMEV